MELRQLRAFKTVAQLKSFTQAADLLGYAQSSISFQIRSLEEELGVKLFERIGKQISLTKDGQLLLSYADKLLELAKEAREALSTPQIPKGSLTIGAPDSLCTFLLPPLLQEYNQRYPQVEIILKVLSGPEVPRWLKENTVDVAFILDNEIKRPELCCQILSTESMCLFTNPHHPLVSKDFIKPTDLQGQSLILTEQGCYYRVFFEKILANANVQPSSVLGFGSIEAIKRCVINGLGIAFLPRMTLEKELMEGQLVALNCVGTDFSIATQLIYHENKWISPPLACLLELAKELL